uniref:Uncharacterized protein n=1 Tax=Opuntia streptacantha TaxID=393608 RepID=A0A7C9E4G4_OPUST
MLFHTITIIEYKNDQNRDGNHEKGEDKKKSKKKSLRKLIKKQSLNRRKYKEYRKGIEDEKGGWRTEREIGEAKGGFGKENQRITYLLCYSRARTLANKFPRSKLHRF